MIYVLARLDLSEMEAERVRQISVILQRDFCLLDKTDLQYDFNEPPSQVLHLGLWYDCVLTVFLSGSASGRSAHSTHLP
jgi:hypothetical protein